MKKVLAARLKKREGSSKVLPGDVLAYYDERGFVRAHASVLDEQGRLESFSVVIDAQTGLAKRVPLGVYESAVAWLRSFVSRRECLDAETLRRRLHTFRIH